MWLVKAPKKIGNITGQLFGHNFHNGVGLITQPYFYQFLTEEGFITLKEFPYSFPERVERIFIQHHGGFGDTLIIEPVIEAFREIYPDAEITLACRDNARILFKNNSKLSLFCNIREGRFVHYLEQFDLIITFDCVIAGNAKAHITNTYDEYKRWACIPDEISKKHLTPKIYFDSIEVENTKNILYNNYKINKDNKIVTINYHSSSSLRNWEFSKFYDVADKINKEYGFTVLMMGEQNLQYSDMIMCKCPKCGYINTLILKDNILKLNFICNKCIEEIKLDTVGTRYKEINKNIIFPDLSMRDWIISIGLSAYMIGIDSAGLHIAGAAETPCLGVFGSFDPDLRMRYFKNARAVVSDHHCRFCSLHQATCPQQHRLETDQAPCMQKITVDQVFNEFKKLVNEEPYEFIRFIPKQDIMPCPVCKSGSRQYIARTNNICYYDCNNCGASYADQVVDGSKYYNEETYYTVYKKDDYKESQKNIARIINDMLGNKFKYSGNILDIGCAEGSYVGELQRIGWKAEGIEISKYFINHYKQNKIKVYAKDFMTCDIDKKYDVVSFHHSLEHFSDPELALNRCKEFLSKDGNITIIIPYTDNWNKITNTWGHLNTYYQGEHIVLFSISSFKYLCEKCGLEVIRDIDLGGDSMLFVLKEKDKDNITG